MDVEKWTFNSVFCEKNSATRECERSARGRIAARQVFSARFALIIDGRTIRISD